MRAPGPPATAALARDLAGLTYQLLDGFIRDVSSDPIKHAQVLAHGRAHFRRQVAKHFRGLPVDEGIADHVFHVLTLEWRKRHGDARPATLLDQTHVPSPAPAVTPETADDWEIESASSERGRRWFYGSSTPREWLAKLIAMAKDTARGASAPTTH